MASDQTIREAILDRMINAYLKPDHVADPTLRIQDYLSVLRPFDAETLKAGWTIVLAAHKYRTWPEPSAIAHACRRALDERDARGRSHAAAAAEVQAERRLQAADDAMLSDIGFEARRDGWSRSLWLAIREKGDPAQVDLERLRQAAAKTRAQVAGGNLPEHLLSMARRMIEAEREHAARFDG